MQTLVSKAVIAFALTLCATLPPVAGAQDAQLDRMRAALAAPERSADNKARDAARKPVETVQFFAIKDGDTVVDMIAAGGWFTGASAGEDGGSV